MQRTRTLALLATAELLAMSLWFTGTAVLPELARRWNAGLGLASWLTTAVQIGFVAGALFSAAFNLADVFRPSRVLVICALAGAGANAAFAAVAEDNIALALSLRFLTGAFLAGVYPTGMKLLAGWYREGRGLAMGVLIGALTVGSALPHGALALGGLMTSRTGDWRLPVLAASGLAVVAAAIVAVGVHDGPYAAPSPSFDPGQIGEAFRNRRLRLANFGYLGHMWELYSMWGWVAVMLAAASSAGVRNQAIAFVAIAIGTLGCVWAGVVSDRVRATSANEGVRATQVAQRSRVTIWAMAVSGACCIAVALLFDHFWLVVLISLVWGIAVIADSAQFSTIISEVADPRYVGTALTMQVAMGFLLTAVSLRVVAFIAAHWGWRWATASLAIGPALGIWAMVALMRAEREPQGRGGAQEEILIADPRG
ncbi:MAG TPA: MFS transporter [Terriglobales bacterium]|nr:MFS transporter [Terriglobales bacterium]